MSTPYLVSVMSSGGSSGGNAGAGARGGAAGAGGVPIRPAGGAAGGVPAGGVPLAGDPNDFATAMAAAMGVVMQNIPGFNNNSATAVLHMIQSIRKFDGSYNPELWLQDFDQERLQYGLDSSWAIRNIDRVLEGTASTWWKSQRPAYLNGLVAPNAVPDDIYRRLCDSMKSFFNNDAIREKARIENSRVKFTYADDPVQYVAKKVDLLIRMDPNMNNREQVRHLLLGLPDDIRGLVSPGDVDSVDKFSVKLSQQLSLHRMATRTNSSNQNGVVSEFENLPV